MACTTPRPSVFSPTSAFSSRKTRLTAPIGGGRFSGAIQQGDDGLFVRRRAMGAAEAQRPQPADGVGEVFGPDLEGEVSPVEFVMGEGLLDNVLRGVSAHGAGQQGQQRLHGGTRHC